MSSLKEVRNRIISVNKTQKITSAMKMVASAKLHKAQHDIENMLPYEQGMHGVLSRLLAAGASSVDSPYSKERNVENVAIVVFASNMSLCGSYNVNMLKHLNEVLEEYSGKIGKEHIKIYPVGRKVADEIDKKVHDVNVDFVEIGDKPSYENAAKLAQTLMDLYAKKDVDKVELLYCHFKSMAKQIYTRETFIPFNINGMPSDSKEDAHASVDYILEPSADDIISDMMPKVMKLKVFTALLDSCASEHGARTLAIQTATDNANDLLQELNVMYNKSRQQSITNEILDIVAGSMR